MSHFEEFFFDWRQEKASYWSRDFLRVFWLAHAWVLIFHYDDTLDYTALLSQFNTVDGSND